MKSIIKIQSTDCDGFRPCGAPVCAVLNSVLCEQMVTIYLSGALLIVENPCEYDKKGKKERIVFS